LIGFSYTRKERGVSLVTILLCINAFLAFFLIPKLQFIDRTESKNIPFPKSYYLVKTDKKPLKLEKDKIYVISFWDSSCRNCFSKIPILLKLKESFDNERIVFIEVNTGLIDDFKSFIESTQNHNSILALNPVYDYKSNLSRQIELNGVPRQLIVKNNIILYDILGYNNEEDLFFYQLNKEIIEKHL